MRLRVLFEVMLFCAMAGAQAPSANYDESKVPKYVLPDPLVTLHGKRIKNAETWEKKRRPEILKLFETEVYGRTMVGRPKEMTWELISTDANALAGSAIAKTVAIYFAGKKDGPQMELHIVLPVKVREPVALFLMPTISDPKPENLLRRGYGLAYFNPASVEPDQDDGYPQSVRAYFAKPGQSEPGPDEWGALGAWAWAMSRAMDYLVTDPEVDARKISITGFSRYGKVAMWAGAQDERFAIVFSGESGCGGATIVRRQYGETVKAINAYAPHWFDRNFKSYAERVNELPVDWHMLIALMAPRPVYIATAEEDRWGDPRGSFLAAKSAESVYKLFGKAGLGVDEMPPLETSVGGVIGFHNRKGAHGLTDYDWEQFLNFADRQFGRERVLH